MISAAALSLSHTRRTWLSRGAIESPNLVERLRLQWTVDLNDLVRERERNA
jgi:hypothetical protein